MSNSTLFRVPFSDILVHGFSFKVFFTKHLHKVKFLKQIWRYEKNTFEINLRQWTLTIII